MEQESVIRAYLPIFFISIMCQIICLPYTIVLDGGRMSMLYNFALVAYWATTIFVVIIYYPKPGKLDSVHIALGFPALFVSSFPLDVFMYEIKLYLFSFWGIDFADSRVILGCIFGIFLAFTLFLKSIEKVRNCKD